MIYIESRAVWRKLWRKEPGRRQMELSHHARMLPGFFLMHADDAGCLAPVATSGAPASILAQVLSIAPRERRGFYREVEELIEYGDDGEPLGLVIRDGHFYLTRFEECQANRTRDSHRAVDVTVSEQLARQSLPDKPPESRDTETDLATEERRKKIEDRSYNVGQSEDPGPPLATNASPPSNVAANMDPGLWLRGEWERRQAHRSTPAKWKPDYQPHLDSIVRKASEATGDTFAILNASLDALFADPDQQRFGCIPKGLDWKWDQFAGPYLEQIEAAQRSRRAAEAERRHKAEKKRLDDLRLQEALANLEGGHQSNGRPLPQSDMVSTDEMVGFWSGKRA